jgi:hypothetical protein
MNGEPRNERTALAYAIAVLGAFLIVALLVWAMHHYTQPPALNANRAAERAKALAELHAAENDALNNLGWVDQSKGIVRLQIKDAMQIVQRDWSSNPTAARSNLIARVEKATAVVAPPPSPFE